MSDTQHTPGPWKVKTPKGLVGLEREGDRLIVSEETKEHVAAVFQYRNDNHKDKTTSLANAEFIVTACNSHADLLAACEALIGRAEKYATGSTEGGQLTKQLRAAIAKATDIEKHKNDAKHDENRT